MGWRGVGGKRAWSLGFRGFRSISGLGGLRRCSGFNDRLVYCWWIGGSRFGNWAFRVGLKFVFSFVKVYVPIHLHILGPIWDVRVLNPKPYTLKPKPYTLKLKPYKP